MDVKHRVYLPPGASADDVGPISCKNKSKRKDVLLRPIAHKHSPLVSSEEPKRPKISSANNNSLSQQSHVKDGLQVKTLTARNPGQCWKYTAICICFFLRWCSFVSESGYLWWSLCTLSYLLACQVIIMLAFEDFVVVFVWPSFGRWLTPFDAGQSHQESPLSTLFAFVVFVATTRNRNRFTESGPKVGAQRPQKP